MDGNLKVIPLKGNNLVVQSNELVNAKYKLGLQEGRLLYAAMSLIEPDDEDFKKYKINIIHLADYLGIVGGNIYGTLKEISKSLIKKTILVEYEEGWKQFPLLTFSEYSKSDNSITLQFHPEMKPFLLNQSSGFTQTKLQNLIRYGSSFSPRIYLFLKEYLWCGKRSIEFDELREKLGAENYPYAQFRKRIILPAQLEVGSYSDIRFEFVEEKLGKRIHKLTFFIYKNTPQSPVGENLMHASAIDPRIEIREAFARILLKKFNISLRVGMDISKDCVESAPKIISYIESQCRKNKNIQNVGGFAVNIIKNREYELLGDEDSGFESFLTKKKTVALSCLPDNEINILLEECFGRLSVAISKTDLKLKRADLRKNYLRYFLGLEDGGLEKEASKALKILKIRQQQQSDAKFANAISKIYTLLVEDGIECIQNLRVSEVSNSRITFVTDTILECDIFYREMLEKKERLQQIRSILEGAVPDTLEEITIFPRDRAGYFLSVKFLVTHSHIQ